MTTNVTIDRTRLDEGLNMALSVTKRSVPEICNTSAYWIAVNAKQGLPYVTPEKINTELGVVKQAVFGKRGKPLKNKKRYISTRMGDSQQSVPMAALIVAARANPSSVYNRLTNSRYLLSKNPFKGVSRAAGRAAMAALIDKMVKTRRRSTKFLLAGWIPAIRKLMPFTKQKYIKGSARPLDGASQYFGGDLGDATVAIKGGYWTRAVIENAVGMEGQNAASFNRALMTYGAPALQIAVDREGEQQAAYALKQYEKELKETVQPKWS